MDYTRRIKTILLIALVSMIFFSFVIRFQSKKSSSNPISNRIAYAIPAMTYTITDNRKISIIPASIPLKPNHLPDFSGPAESRFTLFPIIIIPERETASALNNSTKKESISENTLDFQIHTVKKKSNLKKLAKQFYGSFLYYPVIIEHNSHITFFEIQANTMIRILKNRRQVKHIYNTHRETDKGRLFWRYTTKENDTIESICQKFYHTQQPDIPIVNLNPENRLRPGEIVKIRME